MTLTAYTEHLVIPSIRWTGMYLVLAALVQSFNFQFVSAKRVMEHCKVLLHVLCLGVITMTIV